MPRLDWTKWKKNCCRCAFIQPLDVATASARARPRWKVPLDVWLCCLRGALGALSLSLSVEEGWSTFGIMLGIWAKF